MESSFPYPMKSRLKYPVLCAATFAAILSLQSVAFAESGDTLPTEVEHPAATTNAAPNTIVVEQRSLTGPIGEWTFLKPNGAANEAGKWEVKTLTDLPAGSYTLIAVPPDGSSSIIGIYTGETLVKEYVRTQANITLNGGETYTMRITYFQTKTGSVTVNSDPQQMKFKLDGPNGLHEEGLTPMSFENVPEGQYSVQYEALEGCTKPKPLADQLVAKGRVSFNIDIKCETADRMRDSQQPSASEQNISVTVNGKSLIMRDVAKSAWFSSAVFDAIKKGVLSGYRDEAGELTGEFGPGNSVTVAELAKIAHKIGSVNEEAFAGQNPENPLAVAMWATPFFASAESRGWIIFTQTGSFIDPARAATRGEVLVTLLQALKIPLEWQTGTLFTDVTVRTPYAAAIETAARAGIVEGRKDENGKPLNLFGPTDPINRAEIAKMLVTIMQKYKM